VRGIDPGHSVLGKVLRVLDSVLSGKFTRRGRIWTSKQVGREISRVLLPAAGARAPAADGANLSLLLPEVRIDIDTRIAENSLDASVVRALELAELAADADDAMVKEDFAKARDGYLRALEQAPRHRDLVLTVAEMDLLAGGREYAALGLISETLPAIASGLVGAELLQAQGDTDAAMQALDATIRGEHYAPLRAHLQLRKASIDLDARSRLKVLDAAVASAPTLSATRWVRFGVRAARGDVEGALADAQYLETCANGLQAKFRACIRCGSALFDAGLTQQASRFFERALRYRPDDPNAAVGLARSFVGVGQPLRAIALLERATSSSAAMDQTDPHAQLLLACLLAKHTADLPQAIARVRQIAAGTSVAAEARLWEGRWRLALGDIIGTSAAWARMLELVELGQHCENAQTWLIEAATFERDVRRDLACAERYLAAALRLTPQDATVNELYRAVAATLAINANSTPASPVRDPT
jgi:tetratricopeptide (TPR) repeat protein